MPVGELPLGVFPLKELQLGILLERTHQIPDLTIDTSSEDVLLETRANAPRDIPRRRPYGILPLAPVGEGYFYHIAHKLCVITCLFLQRYDIITEQINHPTPTRATSLEDPYPTEDEE